MNPYNFSLLFFSFCTFFIGLLVWLKRQDSVGKIYFVFCLFVTFWGVPFAWMISSDLSASKALLCSRLLNSMAIFIPITWVHFTMIYTDKYSSFRKHPVLVSFYSMGVMLFLCVFHPVFIPSVSPFSSFDYYTNPGPLFHVFTVHFFAGVFTGFWFLWDRIRKTSGEEKFQTAGLFIATAAGFFGGAMTFLPCYGVRFPLYCLFLMPVYPFVMAYFMIRGRLFNIEQAIDIFRRDKLAAIGTLAASINHEIRNPLYIIQGLSGSFLENRREKIYPQSIETLNQADEFFERVNQQATRAMDIMKSFALFARQEAVSKSSNCSLGEVLERVLPLVSHDLQLEKIELVKNVPENLAPVQLDLRQGEEIFFNLIVNACQAIKNETSIKNGRVEISAAQHNGSVHIWVKDNGPGIPLKHAKEVFEPFYTTKQEGTGLGLYVTRQLIEKNGGKISVKSKPGEGTAFLLELKRS